MDTELARTFMAVVTAGNFMHAARHLHVTQSTVSARIRSLEQQLGSTLFIRNKAGTTLTAAGRQFQRHASTLVRTVEQARQDVGVIRGFRASVTIGGRIGLWDGFLLNLLPLMAERAPYISVRAEIGFEDDLMQGVVEGRIDIGVMYTPQSRPGLTVELLFEDRLIFVATDKGSEPCPAGGYVYVDWGPEFYARHNIQFPDFAGPRLTANIGWLGLRHILAHGGSGYFPVRLIRDHVADGRLAMPEGAPSFSLPAYLVYPEDADPETFGIAVTAIRELAAAEQPASSP
jgi:DNA-binding transcriptional LysR family regulator